MRSGISKMHYWVQSSSSDFTGPLPQPRSGHTAVLVGKSKIVFFGGLIDRKFLGDIFVYDIENKLWFQPECSGSGSDGQVGPSPRAFHVAVSIDCLMFIFGGRFGSKSAVESAGWVTFGFWIRVQNAIDFLKMIGALDEKENLTNLGKFLSILPVDPKLGKMLIMGAIFHCFDPVLTIVSGLSVRDPFLLPQDKKDLAGTAKSRFSAKDYSDHMALVRAYEGWKDADREGSSYEYCWRNFLSAQTLQAIHSLRKQFSFILRDAGLVDTDAGINNKLSHNQSLVRAIICSGLYPGIVSVVQRETSMSFKTMDDGQVMIYANSVNARYQTIPYPWLVFGEKVKVNTVFVRDSTGVSDSVLILFGGALNCGVQAGHLKMLSGYIDFFMDPNLAECYLRLKEELDKLIQKKLEDHSIDIHKEGKYLLLAVQELVSGDQCEGRFVFGRDSKKPKESTESRFTKDGTNPKSLLQTLLMRAGHSPPKYKTKHIKTNEFRALVEFKGMQFVGKPKKNKQLAERDAAIEALAWLTSTADNNQGDDNSPPDVTENMLKLLGKRRRSKPR